MTRKRPSVQPDPTADLGPEPSEEDELFDDEAPERPWWRRVLVEWMLPVLGLVVIWQGVGWLRAPSLPDAAPDFTLQTLEGETVRLSDFRGQQVVLNFWATWCGPCRIEAPSFASFAENNPDVVVLGMTEDDDPAKVRRAQKELGLTYPLVLADDATLQAYGISTYPTTVIVDEQGFVSTAHTGILFRPQVWLMTTVF